MKLQRYQSLYCQKYEKNHSNCFLALSFSEILYHEETCQNQIFEHACIETIHNEPFHDDDHLLLQGINDQEVVFLDPCDNQNDIFLLKHLKSRSLCMKHARNQIY